MSAFANFLSVTTRPFDVVSRFWSGRLAAGLRASALVAVFLGSIAMIEADRQGILPGAVGDFLPEVNHLAAIGWTVSLLLVFELVALTLSLAKSVAGTLGAHLEVYSLILLRDAFVQLSEFGEPLETAGHMETTLSMLADAAGAIVLFVIVNIYGRMQRHHPITPNDLSQQRFVAIKKLIGLSLMVVLVGLLTLEVRQVLNGGEDFRVFDIFFTALVFVDVLLALVSLGFSDSHPIVFRNFGFAFVAVMLRLALASEDFYRPALGVVAGLIALGVAWAYNDALRPVQAIRRAPAMHADHDEDGSDPPPNPS